MARRAAERVKLRTPRVRVEDGRRKGWRSKECESESTKMDEERRKQGEEGEEKWEIGRKGERRGWTGQGRPDWA